MATWCLVTREFLTALTLPPGSCLKTGAQGTPRDSATLPQGSRPAARDSGHHATVGWHTAGDSGKPLWGKLSGTVPGKQSSGAVCPWTRKGECFPEGSDGARQDEQRGSGTVTLPCCSLTGTPQRERCCVRALAQGFASPHNRPRTGQPLCPLGNGGNGSRENRELAPSHTARRGQNQTPSRPAHPGSPGVPLRQACILLPDSPGVALCPPHTLSRPKR